MSRRLLGIFSPEIVIRVLNFIPGSEKSLILRCGGRNYGRPDHAKEPPSQHNSNPKSGGPAKPTTMEETKGTTKAQVNDSTTMEETKMDWSQYFASLF
ncbi:hypothetical protein QN277_008849 [Acacia crassicarpa]|uniref:Uncharacterized protein n=1 Tax=Acacia crassicarpa TaxID=499986 RepID=A0AAE1M735_9FABA|nr:hypothetical protein QN277_008849 [Acacia crassicarpa]